MGDDEIFKKMAEGEVDNLPWFIHEEQVPILTEPLPICANGTAGSGKTTLGIYRLVKEEVRSRYSCPAQYPTQVLPW